MKKTPDINYQDIPLFENISEEDLNTLLLCLRSYERSFNKGEVIILDNESVHYIGIVLSGTVHMIKEDIWGEKALMTYMDPGELFGESFAVRRNSQSSVTFTAGRACNILFVPSANIIHSCPRRCTFHTQLTQNMFDLLGLKSQQLMEKIEISSKPSMREKILAYLSMLSQRQGSRYVKSPLTRTGLAEYLSVNRSSMTRELSAMRDEGLIDFDKDTYVIKDRS